MQLDIVLCPSYSLGNMLNNHGHNNIKQPLTVTYQYTDIIPSCTENPCPKTKVNTCTAQMSPATSSLLVPHVFISIKLLKNEIPFGPLMCFYNHTTRQFKIHLLYNLCFHWCQEDPSYLTTQFWEEFIGHIRVKVSFYCLVMRYVIIF